MHNLYNGEGLRLTPGVRDAPPYSMTGTGSLLQFCEAN